MIKLTLALGLLLGYPATMVSAKPHEISVHPECTRDRCVYYHGSQRIFSIEKEQDTNRYIIRDADRKMKAKVQQDDEDGTLKVEKPYWQR